MARKALTLRSWWTALFALVLTLPASAQTLVRVPQDFATLQQALDRQRLRGGIIELAEGTYAAPNRGFRLRNPRFDLTVRGAEGATVILEGEGAHTIFEFENSARENGQRVLFQNLVFRNGFTQDEKIGGAVSVIAAEASFLNCRFENNRSEAPTTGGGAVLIFDDSDVVFLNSEFADNSAQNRGGAVTVVESTAEFHGSTFLNNRTNLPGHADNAAGGAIYVFNSKVRAASSHFEGNQTGWVGGAIWVFGDWQEPLEDPAAELQVFDSTFFDNLASNDSCCVPPGPTAGGAIHIEDHATVRVYRSEFLRNQAETGGAIDNYRGVLEVFDSVLRSNFTAPQNLDATFGGAIFLVSSDFNDATTDFGAINRRPASLVLENSFLQGSLDEAVPAAQNGACLAAVGDINRRFGDGAVPQDGSIADNRAQVVVRESAFFDCDVEGLPNQGGSGFGGALNLRLANLQMEDSLVLGSECRTDNCGGGGIGAFGESLVGLTRSTLAGNSAHRGAGIFLSGSTIQATASRFVANRISAPGGTTDIRVSRGAGIFAIPGFSAAQPERNTDVDGSVVDSTFADNEGLPIWDVDVDDGPHNTVTYDGNRFGPTGFTDKVYVNQLIRVSGETASQLNNLVVRRGDGTSTDKSQGGNLSVAAPREGTLLAVPRDLSRPGPGTDGGRTFLAFAWSGANADLNGQNLAQRSGIQNATTAGSFRLGSGAEALDEVDVVAAGCSTGPLLCLNEERFKLGVEWATPRGQFGAGQSVQLTDDTGYFFFFNESNVEMVVKVLDGCGNNGHYWSFAGGLTNVNTRMRVVDSLSGQVQVYDNPQRTPFQPIQDTGAFPSCQFDPALAGFDEALRIASQGLADPLLLNNERFEVSVRFRTPRGQEGEGQPVQLTSDTGYYFFFNESNVEMVIKVLRGCGINGNYWVFAGGLTNVEVEITVTDTDNGTVRTYTNPVGTPFQPIQDTEAFPTCP